MCCRVGLPSLTCCGSSSAPRRRRRPEPSELASEVIVHAHRTAESGICTCEPLEAVHSRATLCPWMSTSYHRLSIIQEESPHRRRRVLVVVSNVNHRFARRLVHSPHDLRVRTESFAPLRAPPPALVCRTSIARALKYSVLAASEIVGLCCSRAPHTSIV